MRLYSIFFLAAVGTFIVDQSIKDIFVAGYNWQSDCFSLELHYNRGVAFSMLASVGAYLKWIQAVLIVGMMVYLLVSGLVKKHAFVLGLLVGAALGNLCDRFVHEGVVDYLYWHCGFEYPVFNYADVMIVIAMVWFLLQMYREHRQEGRA